MSSTKPINFSKDLKELEAIVDWFEGGDVDLDAALPKFERGMQLATELREYLASVQNKVEVIKKRFDAPAATVTEEEEA